MKILGNYIEVVNQFRKGRKTMEWKNKAKKLFSGGKSYRGILLAFIVICMILAIASPAFLTSKNILSVLRQIAVNSILAYGMTLVLLTGGIDLTVSSVVSLASIICAKLIGEMECNVWLVVFLALAAGALAGAINGVIICKTRMWPFIVTLAMAEILSGIASTISSGSPVRVMNETFNLIGTGFLGPISLPIIYTFVLLIICYILLQKTRTGRNFYAVGGNEEAARFAGISAFKVRILAYILSGLFAAFAGIFLTARMYTGNPVLGAGMETDAIAAAVVGGASMAGGKARIFGTLLGAMVIGVISNGMNLLGISSYLQAIAKGIIILFAVYMDILSTKKLEKSKG